MMRSFRRLLEEERPTGLEIAARLDGLASEVLQARADALSDNGGEGKDRGLDHFFGTVIARDRLEVQLEESNLYVVAAIDALFSSFTVEVDDDWYLLTGLEHLTGNGWWWSRMPVSGPVRVEFERLMSQGLLDRLRQS